MQEKQQKKSRRFLDACFVLAIVGFLVAGAGKAYFFPKDVNIYENRTANQMPNASDLADGTFQDDVEAAFADQILLAQTLESEYHYMNSTFQQKMIAPYLARHQQQYIRILNALTFGGSHLVFETRDLQQQKPLLEERAANLNKIIDAHPELNFYAYYIEKETDLDLVTSQKVGLADTLGAQLHLPDNHFGVFRVDSFATLDSEFYKTDHHWNCYGSYRGYRELLSMIASDEQPLQPVGEAIIADDFSGSKASTIGAIGVFDEPFPAYHFNYPPMDITLNGRAVTDYGKQNAYFDQTETAPIAYAEFYGGDAGEIIFDTHQPEKENILVIGESYDNAILKLLAKSYNVTCSVDLRNYERDRGQAFRFADYVAEHNISTVLFIGNIDYYVSSDFNLED